MPDVGPDPGERPPPRGRAVAVAVVAGVLLLVALVVLDLARVRQSAFAARESLASGLDALERGDVAVAAGHLEAVERHVDAAADGVARPGWRLVRRLPGLADDLAVAEVAVAAADAATDVAAAIVAPVASLTDADGTTRIRDEEGRLDLRPVAAAASTLVDLDLDDLASALEELAGTPATGLQEGVATGREETLVQGGRLLAVARDVRTMAGVLPTFLGAEEPREYFLAMQNVAEGRGTGGLIGFFATVRIDEEGIELTSPERYEVLDQSVAAGPLPPIGVDELPDGYLDRYGQFDPTTFLANANLDPDFPTVARVLLNLYEEQRGRRLDGVIAMDPLALAFAHVAIGPVELPEDLHTGGLPRSIPPAALPQVLMVDAYDVLGGPSEERKAYLAEVARSAFDGVTSARWSALAMARWLAVAAERKHLQLYSEAPSEQQAFEQLDLAGRFSAPEEHDLLAVTFNNSAGNKMDVHVGHSIGGEIWLEPTDGRLRRRADLAVTVRNPLPTSGRDVYIIGAHRPNQGFVEFFTDRPGLNRTWFTVWAPDDVTEVELVDAEGEPVTRPRQHALRGMVAVDHVLETPSMEERSFRASLAGPVPTSTGPDGSLHYRLVLPRQSKAVPDRLDLWLRAPDGWYLEPTALQAGSQDTPTFGLDGEAGPDVTLARDGAHLHLHGDRNRDVVLHVRLVPDGG